MAAPSLTNHSRLAATPAATISYVRAIDAVAQFAQSLPYRLRCSDSLDRGLTWAPRGVALLHDELAPDPPGWRTALRFDMDCPCDRRPHAKTGYCPRAATYWRDVALPEPSFTVTNPRNGHAHYIYLLAGWIRIDGANVADLAAVRYYAAIERAYTRALRADPGYASLVHHNPFSPRYETTPGRDAPYSLSELASFVELTTAARRQATEIRAIGRNVETFDRLRFWAYANVTHWRARTYDDWADVVATRALEIAALVRPAYPSTSHSYTDAEALDTAKSVAGWVWLRYDGANPDIANARAHARRLYDQRYSMAVRRARGCISRDAFLQNAQARRERACALRSMGLAIDEIARRLGAGIRSVYRWIAELRSVPRPSAPSDFEARPSPQASPLSSENFAVDQFAELTNHPHRPSELPLPPDRAAPAPAPADTVATAPESPHPRSAMDYIRDRIAQIIKRSRSHGPPR